jgi:hypothetical protein
MAILLTPHPSQNIMEVTLVSELLRAQGRALLGHRKLIHQALSGVKRSMVLRNHQ